MSAAARASLLETARRRTVLADGGMGTELQGAGLEAGGCGDLWNLDEPERVLAIQKRYVEAGSEVILTNTFGSNRYVLARYGAEDRVTEINVGGAAIARRAAGERAWVLGDIGPFGGFLAPLGEDAEEDVFGAFRAQARALLAGGVDGIIVETMTAPEELRLAVAAARDAGAGLVIGSVAFDATRVGLRTMMGATPEQAASTMMEAGVDVLGANCGTGLTLSSFAEIVRRYRSAAGGDALVMVQANAGQPELSGTSVVYSESPADMASRLGEVVDAGAAIVGGCCGTTPAHIAAFARELGERGGARP